MILGGESNVQVISKEEVSKKTSNSEYKRQLECLEYVDQLPTKNLNCGLELQVVPPIAYESGCLISKLCNGINLEEMSRHQHTRSLAKTILADLLLLLQEGRFEWGDIAPRNIILDTNKRVLWILDFEKDTFLETNRGETFTWERHLHSYGIEELCCYYNPNEVSKMVSFDIREWQPTRGHLEETHYLSKIRSRRKRYLLSSIFESNINLGNVIYVEKCMHNLSFPFKINSSKYSSSMFFLEKLIKEKGLSAYQTLIYKRNNIVLHE